MSRKLRLFILCATMSVASSTLSAQSADLSVTKLDSPDPVEAGSNITWTMTVGNEGPDSAADVTLSDPLPAGTTFQSVTAPGGWICTTPAVGANGTVSCSIATLSPGSFDFTLVAQVDPATVDGTVISNTATVTSTTTDPSPNDNSATADTTVQVTTPIVTLSIAIADAPDPVTAGYDVTYTITASTTHPDAIDAVLTAPVPANTTFQSFTAPGGWSCTTPAIGGTGNVSCTSATLASGDTIFSLTVRVNPLTPGGTLLTDNASIGIVWSGRDESASDSESTTVNAPTVLSATKSISGALTSGSALVYTIVLTNEGPAAQADNAGNELTDVLPSSLTLVSATATSGTAVATVATNTVTWDGALAAGASVTITINATIKTAVAVGTIVTNQASLSWDGDSDGTNDATGVSDDPATGAPGDGTAFAVAAVPAIPVAGPLGLAIMASLLALVGVVTLRRLG
ncbi:MAG: DUF11 domain-containing protein [Thermoanaerobaculia bacterium]|jgi:uncharacterized repeat protein (TIGR01451 family)